MRDAGRGMAGCRITLSLATRLRIWDLAKPGPPHRGPRIPCARQDGHRKIGVPMLRQAGFAAAPRWPCLRVIISPGPPGSTGGFFSLPCLPHIFLLQKKASPSRAQARGRGSPFTCLNNSPATTALFNLCCDQTNPVIPVSRAASKKHHQSDVIAPATPLT
jgi:hypothetical protein